MALQQIIQHPTGTYVTPYNSSNNQFEKYTATSLPNNITVKALLTQA